MLLILTVLVVVHEWGHYISARIFGVKINEFSIFMGPKIFSRVGMKEIISSILTFQRNE